MTTQINDSEVVSEFAAAWDDPSHTRIVNRPIDVNAVLHEHYRTSRPLTFTRTMLWDLVEKKAASPGTYIPYVVRHRSDRSWSVPSTQDGHTLIERHSHQRLWLAPGQYGLVLERAELDDERQAVTFIGQRTLRDPDGRELHATNMQPLFHVEHAVGGTEHSPLNLWRIVHLTESGDPRLLEVFTRIGESPWLPEYIEIYIRHDLRLDLSRRDDGDRSRRHHRRSGTAPGEEATALSGDYEPSTLEWVRDHVEQVLATGTTDGVTINGRPTVLLTYRGAKTGKIRKTPVMRVEHDGVYAAIASKGGEPTNPQWYSNVVAEPIVLLQDGATTQTYRARQVSGDEKTIWWRRAVDAYPDYADYQRRTDRQIPVLVLEPVN
jgi:deazaflavin-dependent oxidoreductase (nitroreductase family)